MTITHSAVSFFQTRAVQSPEPEKRYSPFHNKMNGGQHRQSTPTAAAEKGYSPLTTTQLTGPPCPSKTLSKNAICMN